MLSLPRYSRRNKEIRIFGECETGAEVIGNFRGVTVKTVGENGIVNIPHLGASTFESEDHCAVMAAKQLDEFLTTGHIKNSVNYPAVSIPHNGASRICIAHRNIANILSSVTSIVSGAGINIENLSNGSKGEFAYTIVEMSVKVPTEIIPKIEAVEGVIRVRVIE